jgi:hypothetical protein
MNYEQIKQEAFIDELNKIASHEWIKSLPSNIITGASSATAAVLVNNALNKKITNTQQPVYVVMPKEKS